MDERQKTKDENVADDLIAVMTALIKELRPQQPLPPALNLDSSLDRDAALDSLGRVELIARIERHFQLTLPERTFAEAQTPRDLLRAVLSAQGLPLVSTTTSVQQVTLGRAESAPESAQTLIDVLHWHVQTHPDRPHIQFYQDDGKGEVLSYNDLWDGARGVATALQQRGLQTGDPVAIMLQTGQDYFFSFFGVLLAGGVPVSMYPPARPNQIEDHLRRHQAILLNCQATTLITEAETKTFSRLMTSLADTLRHVLTIDDLAGDVQSWQPPAITPLDTAFLQYTSGSTGTPKGVVLSHANILTNVRAMGNATKANSKDVFVSWLPLYHDMGLIGAWLGSLYYACLFVVMSPLSFIVRPQRWLWAIHRYRGTLSAAPNFAFELCLNRIEDQDLEGLDLSSWRCAFNGAEAVNPITLERFCERFSQHGFRSDAMMSVYGLAESSVGLAFPPLKQGPLIDAVERETFMDSGRAIPTTDDDPNALRFAACGRPLVEHQIRIVDAAGYELPDREQGRLEFRGPSCTSGYYHNADATEQLFHEGWLDSGDMAYTDHGDLYITGRVKDIIIRAGRNIYPHELEEAVGEVEGVRKGRVAIFGSTDQTSGTERLIIMAETRLKDDKTHEQMRNEINALSIDLTGTPADDIVLAPPNTVLKTSSGKIRRAASREVYEQGRIGKTQLPAWWQVVRISLASTLPMLRRVRRSVAAVLFSAYAWVMFYSLAPFTWAAIALLPKEKKRWSLMGKSARLLARLTMTPFKVSGIENLPPADQPCVFVANHASYIDGPVMVAALQRQFSFVAKAELLQKPIPRIFLQRINTEFVERFDKQQSIADMHQLTDRLRENNNLFFFAEGTFSRRAGLLPFRMGAFLTAAEVGVPIVPVTIRGTRSIYRSGSKFARRGAISVTISKPIFPTPHEAGEQGLWQSAIELRDATRAEILRHNGEPDLSGERIVFDNL